MARMSKEVKGASLPENETREDRFIRLATRRMTRLLAGLNSLGKLTGPRYRSSPAQIAALERAIRVALAKALDRLEYKKARQEEFSFPEEGI